MLKDEDFSNTAKVDRYGRALSGESKKEALKKLYVPEEEEDEEEGDSEEEEEEGEGKVDARFRGFSESESDGELEDEEEDEDGGVAIEEEFPDMQGQQAAVEMGEVTNRFAVVNLDWDNIRSTDLMAVFSSFANGGKIRNVSIYQSEFGKERMEREELEGPPKEIFRKKEDDESDVDSDESEDEDEEEVEAKIKKDLLKADDGKDFDGAALRQYQLERLRYYYAVVVCSDKATAQSIYESIDGSEYLSSANFFDLRFIPDDTDFDDKPRDECSTVPSGYRPNEFVTDALQHSKVKLTWDQNPEETQRKEAIKRAFTGSRAEIGENDLRAYLGSDSEDDDEEEVEEVVADEDTPVLSKKELQRQKMRAALGLADEPLKSSKSTGPVGDMEITFTAGLTSNEKGTVFENEPIKDETTAERYVRLEKERKARRKEKAKAKRDGVDLDAVVDEEVEEEKEDLGFDDPFFATDEAVKTKASKSLKKEEREKKRAAKQAEASASAAEKAKLQLLMQEDTNEVGTNLNHFDINEIQRLEKRKTKKGKKGKKGTADEGEESKRGGLQTGFEMDVQDPRFENLFKSHEFAIDPSNPKFKGTEGMKKLLEEGRRKRGLEGDGDGEENDRDGKKRKGDGKSKEGKGELSGLVESLRKKSKRS